MGWRPQQAQQQMMPQQQQQAMLQQQQQQQMMMQQQRPQFAQGGVGSPGMMGGPARPGFGGGGFQGHQGGQTMMNGAQAGMGMPYNPQQAQVWAPRSCTTQQRGGPRLCTGPAVCLQQCKSFIVIVIG